MDTPITIRCPECTIYFFVREGVDGACPVCRLKYRWSTREKEGVEARVLFIGKPLLARTCMEN